MLRLLLGLSILSLLALTWLITTFESRTNCIESQNIKNVFYFPGPDGVRAWNGELKAIPFPFCGKNIPPTEFSWKKLREPVAQALGSYDRLLEAVPMRSKLDGLLILEKPANTFRIEESKVIIGEGVAMAQGQAFKAILEHWLLNLNSHLRGDLLLLDVLGDFFYAAVNGGIVIENPFSGLKGEYLEPPKVSNLHMNFSEMCHSPWVSASYLSFCSSIEKISSGEKFKNQGLSQVVDAAERVMDNWSPHSLRPIYGHILWVVYLKQSLQERHEILKKMADRIKKMGSSMSMLHWQKTEQKIKKKINSHSLVVQTSELEGGAFRMQIKQDLKALLGLWGDYQRFESTVDAELDLLFGAS